MNAPQDVSLHLVPKERSSEKYINLPRLAQQINGRVGLWGQILLSLKLGPFCLHCIEEATDSEPKDMKPEQRGVLR